MKWEVADDYGKVWFTGTLDECGAWIDPLLGIDFTGKVWPDEVDRFELQPDGSYVVHNYEDVALGLGGVFTVRRVKSEH